MKTSFGFLSLILLCRICSLSPNSTIAYAQDTQGVTTNSSPVPQAASQDNSGQPAPPRVTDSAVYSMFFSHLAEMEKIANDMESKGQEATRVRFQDQRRSGLTESEWAVVSQTERVYWQARQEHAERVKALLVNLGADADGPAAVRSHSKDGATSQIRPTLEEIANNAISQLRQGLGEESFVKLDRYVRSLLRIHDSNVLSTNPDPNPIPKNAAKSPTIDQDRGPRR